LPGQFGCHCVSLMGIMALIAACAGAVLYCEVHGSLATEMATAARDPLAGRFFLVCFMTNSFTNHILINLEKAQC
jgi:hypothetical protein